jgi:hypothetical protein
MATQINNNEYCGMLTQSLSELITIGANDYSLWHIDASTPLGGNKVRMAYVDADVELQEIDGLCSFQDLGDVEVSYMNLTLKELGTQQSICKSDLYATDFGSAGNGFLNQEVDADLLNKWALKFSNKFSKAAQRERWSGDVTISGSTMDGIVKQVKAKGAYDAATNPTGYRQVANTAITSANVIEEMKKVLDELPFEVTSHPMFKLVIAPKVAAALRSRVMLPSTVNNLPQLNFDVNTGRVTDNFFGYNVYMAEGLNSPLVPANNNIVMGGIFGEDEVSSIKAAFNRPTDEKMVEIKDVQDGDFVRIRVATGQDVSVIPNASQIAMNA